MPSPCSGFQLSHFPILELWRAGSPRCSHQPSLTWAWSLPGSRGCSDGLPPLHPWPEMCRQASRGWAWPRLVTVLSPPQFVFLTYVLGVAWLGVFGFSAVPVFMFYNIWSTCEVIKAPRAMGQPGWSKSAWTSGNTVPLHTSSLLPSGACVCTLVTTGAVM